jgi:hypothetical protein
MRASEKLWQRRRMWLSVGRRIAAIDTEPMRRLRGEAIGGMMWRQTLAKSVDEVVAPMRCVAAAMLSWLVPGAGHIYIGERTRGAVIGVCVAAAYAAGLYIGGLKSVVNLGENLPWFFAQMWAGGYTMLTLLLAHLPAAQPAYGKTVDLATIYTAVAGLLNVLVIMDAMARSAWGTLGDHE